MRLIPGLYEPDDGEIRFCGCDLREMEVHSLRLNVGIVPQEPFLFDMSIADNIGCGDVGADRAAVADAARRAFVDEFADELEDGLDTVVRDGGLRLSGGQRQRIAVARAFLKDPRLLLLDEATSSLDTRSERLVRSALDRLRAGRTTLVIAHNPHTFRAADRIIVLNHGRVEAVGTHGELIDRSGLYRDLVGAAEDQHLGARRQDVS